MVTSPRKASGWAIGIYTFGCLKGGDYGQSLLDACGHHDQIRAQLVGGNDWARVVGLVRWVLGLLQDLVAKPKALLVKGVIVDICIVGRVDRALSDILWTKGMAHPRCGPLHSV